MILDGNRQEWKAKNQGVVVVEVDKEEVQAQNPPEPTNEEFKEMFGFTNLIVEHSNGDDVTNICF